MFLVPRRNMQPFGINVSIIEPGFFKTNVTRLDLIEADLRRLWSRLPQDVKDSYGPQYFDDCEWKGGRFIRKCHMTIFTDCSLFCPLQM